MMTIAQAYQVAVQHHQAGRLAEAEAIYRQILALDPRHADSLHLLGVLALQAGRSDLAVDLIRQASALLPDEPAMHSNLGEACRRLGLLDEAIAECRRAIEIQPDFTDAYNNLGVALREQGRFGEAVGVVRLELLPIARRPEVEDGERIHLVSEKRFESEPAPLARLRSGGTDSCRG